MSELDRLYASIPAVVGCKTGCNDCCGLVPMSADEVVRVKSIQRPMPFPFAGFITPTKLCGTCAYSTAAGCSIYADRPFMCRLFGAVDDEPRLICPHGAKAKKPLSREKAAELTARYQELSS